LATGASTAIALLARRYGSKLTQTTAEAAESKTLSMWWFGEQDAKGLAQWVSDSVQMYEKRQPTVKIQATLEPPDGVIPRFRTAAAAHQSPDIQYMWGPIWALEEIWAGRATPLDDFWSKQEINMLGPVADNVRFEGKTYLATWYNNVQGMIYNKDLFQKAKLDPDKVPMTWDEFLSACENLKSAGITPIGVGAKDGFIGEWLFGFVGRQNANGLRDYIEPVIGKSKFTDPLWSEYWFKIAELRDKGYINNDAVSLELYQGQDIFVQQRAAFTWGVSGQFANFSKTIGPDKVRIITTPVFGKGKTAKYYSIGGPHGLFIPTYAKNKKEAADFLRLLHTKERVNAVYTSSGAIPTDPSFDASLIRDRAIQQMVTDYQKGSISGANTIVPARLINDGAMPATQLLLGGSITPAQAAQKLQDTIELWRQQSPEELAQFQKWYASLK
jgi:multiple sugar transport system substrate-binding protein